MRIVLHRAGVLRAGALALPLGLAVLGVMAGRAEAALWGVHYDGAPGSQSQMDLVTAQGSGAIRLPIRWSRVQRERGGPYDWRVYDAYIRLAAERSIRVIANVHGTPDWAASVDPHTDEPHNEAPPTPEHLPAYRAYLGALVARYGPGGKFWRERPYAPHGPVTAWEIHNEPNLARFWTDRLPDAAAYADLAQVSGRTIKEVDPGAEVIVGSTIASCAQICPERLLRAVLSRPGAARWADSVSFHAYRERPGDVLEQARIVRRAVTAHGSPRMGLHLTEFGWGSCTDPAFNTCVGEEAQAERLGRAFELLREHGEELGLRSAHWFIQLDLEPCLEPAPRYCTFGMLDVDPKGRLDPKPAWSAYRRFTGAR